MDVRATTLLNALAHRDYGRLGTTVDVTIWDDRIEIKSPGGLPGPITLDNIRAEHYSRNRRVMRTLKLLGLGRSTAKASIACTSSLRPGSWNRR